VQFAKTRDCRCSYWAGKQSVVAVGLAGLVLRIAIGGIMIQLRSPAMACSSASARASIGMPLVPQAVVQNWRDDASAVSGSVGALPCKTLAYGQEVSDTIESVRALDLKKTHVVLPKPACGFVIDQHL